MPRILIDTAAPSNMVLLAQLKSHHQYIIIFIISEGVSTLLLASDIGPGVESDSKSNQIYGTMYRDVWMFKSVISVGHCLPSLESRRS